MDNYIWAEINRIFTEAVDKPKEDNEHEKLIEKTQDDPQIYDDQC
tara:strand:- start:23608 stop:23742 length:135 start_codon:yes stop_codon:yes gene_type:complete